VKMNVTFVVDRLLPHGAGNIAMLQIRAATAAGHAVTLVTSTSSKLPPDFTVEATFVSNMGDARVGDLDHTMRSVLGDLTSAVRVHRPDIIIAHNYGRLGGNAALRELDRIAPCVVWCHDEYPAAGYHFEFLTYTGILRRSWEPWDQHRIPIARHVDMAMSLERTTFVAPSLWLTTRLAETFGPTVPVLHIPNGIDLTCFAFRDRVTAGAPLRALLAGNVSDPRKNLLLAIRALDLVPSNLVESVTLAGNNGDAGALSTSLITFLRARGVSEVLINKTTSAGWVGESTRMAELYDEANLVLHTSQAENFPTVCLEAEASGVPLIATAAGGTSETVSHGLLVPTDISPTMLASHIESVQRAGQPSGPPTVSTAGDMWDETEYVLAAMLEAPSAHA